MKAWFPSVYDSWQDIQKKEHVAISKILKKHRLGSGHVLDLGSGSGQLTRTMQRQGIDTSQVICLDHDPGVLAQCPGHRILADGNLPPLRPETLQLLLCTDTIHLISGPVSRLVRPGGHCLVSIFFNQQNMREQEDMVMEKTRGLDIVEKQILRGKENTLIWLLKKPEQ